jgi:PAS domain S-box-containing protein
MHPGLLRTARPVLIVALCVAVLLAAAGATVVRYQGQEERSTLEERAATLADAVQSSLTEAMGEHRPETMGPIVEAVRRTEGVAAIGIADDRGIVRRGAGDAPNVFTVPQRPRFDWTERRLTLTRAIDNAPACHRCHDASAAYNGAVLVSLDASAIAPRLRRTARNTGILAAIALAATLGAAALVVGARSQAAQARAQREASRMRLQALVDSMADGVIFIDAEDRIALVNQAAMALRNLTGGPGRPVKDCHPQATHAMLERVLGWLREGTDTGPNHSIIKEKEGRWETTYAPVRAPDGSYLGVVMVIRDIADRRNLERRLLDTERLAAVGQMSAQVAHELRNPLNAITGAAQYLRRILPGHAEVKEYAELIDDEVTRVNRFVDELLKVARPANPVFTPSSVAKVLTEASRRAAVARKLAPDAVRLDLARSLPVLDLDQAMIMEAIVNLLDNAFDAGGAEPPEMLARFEATGGTGSIVVEVCDRGSGIPPEQLDEVTRPFVTTKARGTGLGLVIVTRAVEQHRAHFELASREGGGTVARIRFPVRTVRENVVHEAFDPAEPPRAGASQRTGAKA